MAKLHVFVPKAQRLKAKVAEQIAEQIALFDPADLPEQPRQALLNALHRFRHDNRLESLWPGGFAMISREQTALVWDTIRRLPPERRPDEVRHAFDLVLLNLRTDTGEVMLTRDELAEKMATHPDNVSRVMGTLEEMGVVRRERRRVAGLRGPGMAVYFLNPHVGWAGDLDLRQKKAKEATPPLLRLIEGKAE